MKYDPPIPPYPLKDMSRNEAHHFFEWFLTQIPYRCEQLLRIVNSSKGFSTWKNDFSRESLAPLGYWFVENVKFRDKTQPEFDEIYNSAPDWFRQVELENWTLTNRTYSYAYDLGIYFGEALKDSIGDIDWILKTNSPTSVDYHLPILHHVGQLDCCPYHLMKIYAYAIARSSKGSEHLPVLFDIWYNNLTGQHKTST